MTPRAWFRCIDGCPGEIPLTTVIYRCPTCGALLEVAHDLDALRTRRAAEWMKLFDERYKRTTWPYGSGVWGKKEWVAPQLEDDNVVSSRRRRHQPVLGRALRARRSAWTTCGSSCAATSHTGSFKDLGMTVLVSVVKQMIARRLADPGGGVRFDGRYVGEPGGVLRGGRAFAPWCCCRAGKISAAQLVQPLANGALVLALDTDFDGCMAIVQQLALGARDLPGQLDELAAVGRPEDRSRMEIVQQFDWEVPDWIVIPGGNLGNVSALGRGVS